MAGRPRKMLAKVTALEEQACNLMNATSEAMPERYMERDERMKDNPIWVAWYLSAEQLAGAGIWLNQLRTLLQQKVGEGQTPCEDGENDGAGSHKGPA